MCLRFLKKSVLKLLNRTVYVSIMCIAGHYMYCVVVFQVFPNATHLAVLILRPCILPLALQQPICGWGFLLHIEGRLIYEALARNTHTQEQCLCKTKKENFW